MTARLIRVGETNSDSATLATPAVGGGTPPRSHRKRPIVEHWSTQPQKEQREQPGKKQDMLNKERDKTQHQESGSRLRFHTVRYIWTWKPQKTFFTGSVLWRAVRPLQQVEVTTELQMSQQEQQVTLGRKFQTHDGQIKTIEQVHPSRIARIEQDMDGQRRVATAGGSTTGSSAPKSVFRQEYLEFTVSAARITQRRRCCVGIHFPNPRLHNTIGPRVDLRNITLHDTLVHL